MSGILCFNEVCQTSLNRFVSRTNLRNRLGNFVLKILHLGQVSAKDFILSLILTRTKDCLELFR